MFKPLSLIGVLVIAPVTNLWAMSDQTNREIQYLLNYVQQTQCAYERNGTRHNGEEAVAHIQKKYDYFKDDIETTEDFIEYSATKSKMSGKYYQVHCPGAASIKSQQWLLNALKAYRLSE